MKGFIVTDLFEDDGVGQQSMGCRGKELQDEWEGLMNLVVVNSNSALSVKKTNNYSYWWRRFNKFCLRFGRVSAPYNRHNNCNVLSHFVESSKGIGGDG